MIIDHSIKVKNYKCFGEEEQGFDRIYPINIIIGKNNAGKTSLIDLMKFVVSPEESFITTGRDKSKSKVAIGDSVKEEYIEKAFFKKYSGEGIPGNTHYDYGMTLVGNSIKYYLGPSSQKEIFYWDIEPVPDAGDQVRLLEHAIKNPLAGKFFLGITAERNILPEGLDATKKSVLPNGTGATNLIRQIMTDSNFDLNLVKKELLEAFNEIVRPDIEFTYIAPRTVSSDWEVFFEDKNSKLIPLSRMGSGIKTILLVLLNLIVIPAIEGYKRESLFLGFEELENNLHPSLQRRLFYYIIEYAKKYNSYFFITTHSNIVIDMFGSNEVSQIIHVKHNGDFSVAKTIVTPDDGRNVLKDLDFRASDLLMSNGIIWVEGPSDVIYLEFLLDLIRKESNSHKRKYNYSIQSLATAIWKYAGFTDFDWSKVNGEIENKIISLEKLNFNHLLIIDRDNNYEDKKPSEWKQFKDGTGRNKAKLISESMNFVSGNETDLINNSGETFDKLLFWITEGTFESYLEYFINTKGKFVFSERFDAGKSRGFFEKRRSGENSSISKVQLAIEIAKFGSENNLTIDDFAPKTSPLRYKLVKLENTIGSWN